jgi:hypothetical protein
MLLEYDIIHTCMKYWFYFLDTSLHKRHCPGSAGTTRPAITVPNDLPWRPSSTQPLFPALTDVIHNAHASRPALKSTHIPYSPPPPPPYSYSIAECIATMLATSLRTAVLLALCPFTLAAFDTTEDVGAQMGHVLRRSTIYMLGLNATASDTPSGTGIVPVSLSEDKQSVCSSLLKDHKLR